MWLGSSVSMNFEALDEVTNAVFDTLVPRIGCARGKGQARNEGTGSKQTEWAIR